MHMHMNYMRCEFVLVAVSFLANDNVFLNNGLFRVFAWIKNLSLLISF